MPTVLQQTEWAAKRLLFLIYYLLTILTGGIMMLILTPLTAYIFFGDFRFWRFFSYFLPGIRTFYYQLGLIITDKHYRDMFTIPLIAPPLKQPDKSIIKLAATWDAPEDECQGCSLCCLKMDCGLFDREKGICMSYDSFYWRYFNCGRYPNTQKQIDYYKCPKWVMRPER